jgi:mannose-6-phosphate isomerase
MTVLYPLKFETIFKEKIWGGGKVRSYLNKDFAPLPNCGETWEISGDLSIVANGAFAGDRLSALAGKHKAELLGHAVFARFGTEFPLLVKFIDANDDLSIQAHPNDGLARERHNCSGKTEMWYVVQADAGASLIAGFRQPIDQHVYLEKLDAGKLSDILNIEPAEAGDVFFLPAGTVHAIGKGLLVAEIQQASDVTYRIHDFDRVDHAGNKRALHAAEALAALDFGCRPTCRSSYSRGVNVPVKVVECDHFTASIFESNRTTGRDYAFDSFVIQICVQGSYSLHCGDGVVDMNLGDCVLIPAVIDYVRLETAGGFTILESYIP